MVDSPHLDPKPEPPLPRDLEDSDFDESVEFRDELVSVVMETLEVFLG